MKSYVHFTIAFVLEIFTISPAALANEIDAESPVIHHISSSTKTVAPGDSIQFYAYIEDASPVTFVSFSIRPLERDALEKTIYLKKNNETGLFEGTYTVPAEAFNEKWKVTNVYAKDIHGNYTSLIDKNLFL